MQQQQNEAISNYNRQNNQIRNQDKNFDFKSYILLKNQENIELYNNELKYLSIKKLNLKSESFVPKRRQIV